MFEKLKKGILSLFSSAPQSNSKDKKKSPQTRKNASAGNGRNRSRGSAPASRRQGRPGPAESNRQKQSAPQASARKPRSLRPAKERRDSEELRDAEELISARPKRPMPTELKEVPPREGKSRFQDFGLTKEVLFGVQEAGFEYCTPIQAMTIPLLLEGRDLAGKAQTGTGKTAAFLLSVFHRLLTHPLEGERKNGTPRALILAPTRELAIQIHKDAEQLGAFTGLNNVLVFGGMDHERQRRSLNAKLDLLIGTPGRVIDYARGSSLDLSRVEVLVIDEADRMLDMGFIPDIRRIVSMLPRKGVRQTLFFSATLDDSILRLSSGWLADPAVIESEPEQMVSDNIEQTFYSVSRDEKLALMLYLLSHEPYERMLIFGNRKDVNLKLQYDLARYGYEVPVLSGDIAQEKRIKILERFRRGETKVVIATDVAARGIHVDDVSLVINYDLPERSEDYIHRIGRTGRAGHQGKSVSFLCEYGAYYLPAIEELLHRQFPSALPTEEMLTLPPESPCANMPALPERRGGFHRGGGRTGGRFGGRSRSRIRR